jgi:tetratricopeptide (TPR) repeat protein
MGGVAGALMLLASPALASPEDLTALSVYAQARAAGSAGEMDKASANYAAALSLAAGNEVLAVRALNQAMLSGDMNLALQAGRVLERTGSRSAELDLLFLAEALKRRDQKVAAARIESLTRDEIFSFTAPLLNAWMSVDTRRGNPLAILNAAASNSLVAGYSADHRPLLLLAKRKRREGLAALGEVIEGNDLRAQRLRIAAASQLARGGDRKNAMALLQGSEMPVRAARALLDRRELISGAIGTASEGAADLLVRIAIDLHRQEVTSLGISFARIATYLAPASSEGWIVLSELLSSEQQQDAAIAALANVPPTDPFSLDAEDARVRMIAGAGDEDQALAEALKRVQAEGAGAAAWARLGDIYTQIQRLDEAAAAYEKAIGLNQTAGAEHPEWALWLLKGGALEQAGRWEEGKRALERAHALAPDQAVVLNYLGYAQLSRRENIEEAARLIEEASRLQPDNAAITDSLGWAHFLRGDNAKAIQLLESAVEAEPADTTINEHLGDAYYTAGRRFEARYAWGAALLEAQGADADRLRAKMDAGLTPELASP